MACFTNDVHHELACEMEDIVAKTCLADTNGL